MVDLRVDMGGLALMVISPKKMGIFSLLYVHIGDCSTTFEVFLVISAEPLGRSES